MTHAPTRLCKLTIGLGAEFVSAYISSRYSTDAFNKDRYCDGARRMLRMFAADIAVCTLSHKLRDDTTRSSLPQIKTGNTMAVYKHLMISDIVIISGGKVDSHRHERACA
jgi:hypothetical protein